jgi:hypothetical protein
MSTRTIRYRGYDIVVYDPTISGQHVMIWPSGNRAPTPMPNHTSENEAIKEARTAIDHILDESTAPKVQPPVAEEIRQLAAELEQDAANIKADIDPPRRPSDRADQ